LPVLRTVGSEGSNALAAIICALDERQIPTPRMECFDVSKLLVRAQKREGLR